MEEKRIQNWILVVVVGDDLEVDFEGNSRPSFH